MSEQQKASQAVVSSTAKINDNQIVEKVGLFLEDGTNIADALGSSGGGSSASLVPYVMVVGTLTMEDVLSFVPSSELPPGLNQVVVGVSIAGDRDLSSFDGPAGLYGPDGAGGWEFIRAIEEGDKIFPYIIMDADNDEFPGNASILDYGTCGEMVYLPSLSEEMPAGIYFTPYGAKSYAALPDAPQIPSIEYVSYIWENVNLDGSTITVDLLNPPFSIGEGNQIALVNPSQIYTEMADGSWVENQNNPTLPIGVTSYYLLRHTVTEPLIGGINYMRGDRYLEGTGESSFLFMKASSGLVHVPETQSPLVYTPTNGGGMGLFSYDMWPSRLIMADTSELTGGQTADLVITNESVEPHLIAGAEIKVVHTAGANAFSVVGTIGGVAETSITITLGSSASFVHDGTSWWQL